MATTITLPVEAIRRESLATAKSLGFPINESLPPLGERASTRTVDEIVDRLLCLNAVAMCACGFDRAQAHAWLSKENLTDKLTALERHFIEGDTGNGDLFLAEIESIDALLWAGGMERTLDVTSKRDPFPPTRVPNPSTDEDSNLFRTWIRPRSTLEIAA